MAKKTTAKAIAKAKPKKPAPKPVAKKPVKKPAPAAKPAKPAAVKGKPAPAKPPAKKAPPKPAPAKPVAKKAPAPPAKVPEKIPAKVSEKVSEKKVPTKISVTKSDSSKPNSMSSTAVGKTVKPKARPPNAGERTFAPYELKKGEDYMNDRQKDHFKKILLNWRNELMQEVDRTVHHMQDEAANPPDPADRATLEEEFSIELRTRDRERRLIKKIDSTIELIANDDYGYCDSCGVEIGIRRLEARPTANKCIDCKTLDEIKEKQLGSP
jgi:DnaK suppressor protein